MRKISGRFGAVAGIAALMGMMLAAATAAPAQTLTTLVNFNGKHGANPSTQILVQGTDGNLHGTTELGGAHGTSSSGGTVFRVTPAGGLTTLYDFCAQSNCSDGSFPNGLALGTDGNFYGTTYYGGASGSGKGAGTVFKINATGQLTTLYSFCAQSACSDGENPYAGLVQGADGYFYGGTYTGGAASGGVIFKISPGGALTTIYSFCSQPGCNDGSAPLGTLVQSPEGNLYGTTSQGGTGSNNGTVFKITTQGVLTTLHSFDQTDGSTPVSGLVQGSDGNFYGTTENGGSCDCGTVFKIMPAGVFSVLHSFNWTDGAYPSGQLFQGTDGNFYGTTILGGASSYGTIFSITPAGVLTTLVSLNSIDGATPYAGLFQATNGTFYGTAAEGGAYCGTVGCGTVFSLSVGLGPFVQTVPTAGTVGKSVTILGNNLSGTTSVTFNGIAATFTIKTVASLKATVPAGATTGPVQVVTPSGTLTSNLNFQVKP